jgi:hypothetical protein
MEDLSKTFKTILLDWKRGTFRAVKRRPKTIKPTEIPINFSIKVNLPKEVEANASGEITLSETKVGEIMIEEI